MAEPIKIPELATEYITITINDTEHRTYGVVDGVLTISGNDITSIGTTTFSCVCTARTSSEILSNPSGI